MKKERTILRHKKEKGERKSLKKEMGECRHFSGILGFDFKGDKYWIQIIFVLKLKKFKDHFIYMISFLLNY